MHSELSQTTKIELFDKKVNEWKFLTIFVRNFILDVYMGSEFAFEQMKNKSTKNA